jgi:hypothetical protein
VDVKEDQDQGVCWGVVSEGFEGVMVECMMSYMLPIAHRCTVSLGVATSIRLLLWGKETGVCVP